MEAIYVGLYACDDALRRFRECLADTEPGAKVNVEYLSAQARHAMNGVLSAYVAVQMIGDEEAWVTPGEGDDAADPDTVLLPPAAQAGERDGAA